MKVFESVLVKSEISREEYNELSEMEIAELLYERDDTCLVGENPYEDECEASMSKNWSTEVEVIDNEKLKISTIILISYDKHSEDACVDIIDTDLRFYKKENKVYN